MTLINSFLGGRYLEWLQVYPTAQPAGYIILEPENWTIGCGYRQVIGTCSMFLGPSLRGVPGNQWNHEYLPTTRVLEYYSHPAPSSKPSRYLLNLYRYPQISTFSLDKFEDVQVPTRTSLPPIKWCYSSGVESAIRLERHLSARSLLLAKLHVYNVFWLRCRRLSRGCEAGK